MKRLHLLLIMLLPVMTGCYDIFIPTSDPQIVVEGWIEDGGYPVVMLTTTVPVDRDIRDFNELKEYMIRWGKVTISDGTQEVVLTGKRNDDYFPPYIYTTAYMKGVPGRTYTIKVEYSGRTVYASTTIPEPKRLEYTKVVRAAESDTLFYIAAGLKDDPSTRNYYKSFIMVSGLDSIPVPSFMGLIDDEVLSEGLDEIQINSSLKRMGSQSTPFFSAGDKVVVRFCTLDENAFNYWSDFDDISSLSTNPFFPVTSQIRSNVRGGLGYWAGYGSVNYMVSIPDSLARGRIY